MRSIPFDGGSDWRDGGAAVGGGGGGGRIAFGDPGLPIGNEDMRRPCGSNDGSSAPKYEVRLFGGALMPAGESV